MANEVQVFEMIAGRDTPVNFRAKQTLSIGGAASAAFDRSATQVRVISTTGCVIEFGTAPDGLGNFFPIVAGQIYDFDVSAGQKVIAVAGTATAPAVSDTATSAAAASLTNGVGANGSATFTPAAASHTAGDCNGAAANFTLAAPSGCRFLITDANLSIASATAEATAWRLYLYNITPPSAIADDAAFDYTVATDGAAFLGYIDLGTAVDLGGGQWVENRTVNKAVKLSGTTVFGYLVNLTTLTPAAVAHTVTLIGTPL